MVVKLFWKTFTIQKARPIISTIPPAFAPNTDKVVSEKNFWLQFQDRCNGNPEQDREFRYCGKRCPGNLFREDYLDFPNTGKNRDREYYRKKH